MVGSIATSASLLAGFAKAMAVSPANYDIVNWTQVAGRSKIRTITVAIMGGDLLSDRDGSYNPKRDVLPLSEELAIIITVVLRTPPSHLSRASAKYGFGLTFTNRAGPKNR
jgi:hypothetical protein